MLYSVPAERVGVTRCSAIFRSLFSFVIIAILSMASLAAQAQVSQIDNSGDPNRGCGADYLGQTWTCNAGEISISQIVNVDIEGAPTNCVLGEPMLITTATVEYAMNTQDVRNMTMYFGDQQGTDPRLFAGADESCTAFSLPDPFNATPDAINPFGDIDGDQCGDLGFSVSSASRTFNDMPFSCQDNDNDGFADIQVLLTWDNKKNTQDCGTDIGQFFPTDGGTRSKCDFDVQNTLVEIVFPPILTLVKEVNNNYLGLGVPTDWTLMATGPTSISGVTGTADVTAVMVDDGNYTLGESGPNGYIGTWNCTGDGTLDQDGVTLPLSNANPAWETTCTLTNNDQPGTLTLVKDLTTDDTAAGSESTLADWTLTATGPAPYTVSGTADSQDVVSQQVGAGSYGLTESGPGGFTSSGWVCVGGNQTGPSVDIALGETVTCTIANDDLPGTLTLVKQVINLDGGTAVADDWTLTADGVTDYPGTTTQWAGGQPVDAGAYTLTESGPAGYTAGAWNCTGTGYTYLNEILTLANGGNATCLIINNDIPSALTLSKVVNNDFGGNDAEGSFPLTLTGADGVHDGGVDYFSGGAQPAVVPGVEYTVSETPNTGYSLSGIVCTDTGDQSDVGTTFTLAEGQSVSCVFTNQDIVPTLTVVKNVVTGSATADQFVLRVTGAGGLCGQDGTAAYTSGDSVTTIESNCAYSLTEDLFTDYAAGTVTCVDTGNGNDPVSHPVSLNEGQAVTCTIPNNLVAQGSATLVKQVNNTWNGPDSDTDFLLSIAGTGAAGCDSDDATDLSTGAVITLQTGCSYLVGETTRPGYTNTSITCIDSSDQSDVGNPFTATGGEGEAIVCTIVNDDQPAQLALVKTVTTDNGGTAVPADWLLTATDGNTPVQGQGGFSSTDVAAGGWALSESGGPSGYTPGPWGCVDAAGAPVTVTNDTVTLANGDNVTCTIDNDDNASGLTLVKNVQTDHGGVAVAGDWQLFAGAIEFVTGIAQDIAAGVYTLSETGPDGYEPSGPWQCSGADTGWSFNPDTVELTMTEGDVVSCEIGNQDIAPRLTLLKEVINDDGGNALPESFTLTLQGVDGTHDTAQNYSSGQMPTGVQAGVTYTMDELADVSGYENTGVACVDTGNADAPVGSGATFTLELDQDVTCTLTNDDVAPTLVLLKDVINDDDGTLGPADFTLTLTSLTGDDPAHENGADYHDGDQPVILAGVQYEVSEIPETGYGLTSIVCEAIVADGANQPLANPFTAQLGQDISCTVTNDGLPLAQTFKISEGNPVNFVVDAYEPGTMNCRVEEFGASNEYSKTFLAGDEDGIADSIDDDDVACYFYGIQSGQFTCEITNNANPATFTAHKEWVLVNEGGEEVDLIVPVTIFCESEIFEDDAVEYDPGLWMLSGQLGDGGSLMATVDATTGPARCSATEYVAQSGVESVDDCYWRDIPAGGSDDCTFTNTVFFEGIPTLNQYGLMVLALLMLGVGAVGFRRFA